MTEAELAEANRNSSESFDYFDALCEERRARPQDDLLTALVQSETEHGKLTKEEARRKLNEAHKLPPRKRDAHKREKKDVNLQRYHEHLRAIENEVKAGRLSKKDAELKIMEIEKKLWPEKHKAKKGYWR